MKQYEEATSVTSATIATSTTSMPHPPASYFVLRVETSREFQAAQQLKAHCVDHYLPSYSYRRRYATSSQILKRALFPGYLFSYFPIEEKNSIVQLPYILDLLSFNHIPATIDSQEMDAIRALVESGPPTPWAKLIPGDKVRVLVGPAAGIIGVLSKIEGNYHFVVNVSMLGRAVSVKVEPYMVEAA